MVTDNLSCPYINKNTSYVCPLSLTLACGLTWMHFITLRTYKSIFICFLPRIVIEFGKALSASMELWLSSLDLLKRLNKWI